MLRFYQQIRTVVIKNKRSKQIFLVNVTFMCHCIHVTADLPFTSGVRQRTHADIQSSNVGIIIIFLVLIPSELCKNIYEMSNNTAPDSWEQQADSGPGESSPSDPADVTAKFSTLNVNAVEFVPSFGVKTSQGDDHNSPTKSQKSESSTNSPDQSPVVNGTCLDSALSTTCCSVFQFPLKNTPSFSQ